MPYGHSLERLLKILAQRVRIEAAAVERHRREVQDGLLSVGIKIHWKGNLLNELVELLGGKARVLDINMYRREEWSCMALPPVGNAQSAVDLIDAIGIFSTGTTLFGNRDAQIQICSPFRLSPRRSALLAIGFYLGSDTLWEYEPGMFRTTAAADVSYHRGEHLVIYDAGGFDAGFNWWQRVAVPITVRNRKWLSIRVKKLRVTVDNLYIRSTLPFDGRTDILGVNSKRDVENINLLATLLVHAEAVKADGYWKEVGLAFQSELKKMLKQHLLSGLIDAPWVQIARGDDELFVDALQELVAYAIEDSSRKDVSNGILAQTSALITCYREKIEMHASKLTKGEST